MFIPYDRRAAVQYAHRWAYDRNPAFYDYSEIGGDCTNFASQCLYAGTGIMNFTPVLGWYYIDPNNKAPAWTGVPYFFNFMTRKERTRGPFGVAVGENCLDLLLPGDFVQIRFEGDTFAHTPIIVDIQDPGQLSGILVAAHSQDSDYRPLSTYTFQELRFIHILGAFTSNGINPEMNRQP